MFEKIATLLILGLAALLAVMAEGAKDAFPPLAAWASTAAGVGSSIFALSMLAHLMASRTTV